MSTISSVFKGYNANRKKSVRKGVPNGRLSNRIMSALEQYKKYLPMEYVWDKRMGFSKYDIALHAKAFGFRDLQLHYTRGWKTV